MPPLTPDCCGPLKTGRDRDSQHFLLHYSFLAVIHIALGLWKGRSRLAFLPWDASFYDSSQKLKPRDIVSLL